MITLNSEQETMKTSTAEELTDTGLVTRCQTELPYESGAFERLALRYQNKVYGKVLIMINNRDEAADLTQDIFVKVFHGLPSFRQDASFSTWLYTITVNTCFNHLDRMRHRPWWGIAVNIDITCVDVLQNEELCLTAGQTVEQTELGEMIEQTMGMVSDTSRETILLRHERAKPVGEFFRKHRDDSVDEIGGISPRLCFNIENTTGLHVM